MKKKRSRSAMDDPLRVLELVYEDGECFFYIETRKHYFYRSVNGVLKRISANEFESALAEYYDY